VSMKCPSIVVCCSCQQLTVDLATVCPTEDLLRRLDWVKSLIMGLLYAVNPADEMRSPHLLMLLRSILQYLGTSSKRIEEIQALPADKKRQMQLDIKMLMTIIEGHVRSCGGF